jgi:hypothetical protein
VEVELSELVEEVEDVPEHVPLSQDWLSLAMIVGVALLGLMYWLDSRQRDALERAEQAARAVELPAALSSCQRGAASLGGEQLSISCAQLGRAQILDALSAHPLDARAFSSLAARGHDGVLVCPMGARERWPEACASRDVAPRAFYEEASKRRPRESQ